MKRKQLEDSRDLQNDGRNAHTYNRMQEELKFYHRKNQILEESLAGTTKALGTTKTKAEERETKLAALSPNQSPKIRESELQNRLKSMSEAKGLKNKVNIVNRSHRSMTNSYSRRI